jgi:hypothetical protein
MSHRPATFTQADVARAIRAAKQAGAERVEVEGGKITIHLKPSTGEETPLAPEREIAL